MAGWAAAPTCGSNRVLKVALLVLASIAGCGQGSAPAQSEKQVASTETHDVAVYVLSRGAGVPEATRAARDKARALLRQLHAEKRALTLEETPIGLEGERRICATFSNAQDAADAAARLRAIGAGVELFNIVMEPCARAGAPLPQQGVKP
jgi:hypothetical protein